MQQLSDALSLSLLAFLRWGIMFAEKLTSGCVAVPGLWSDTQSGPKSAVFNYRFPRIFHMFVAAANVDGHDDEHEDSKKYVLCRQLHQYYNALHADSSQSSKSAKEMRNNTRELAKIIQSSGVVRVERDLEIVEG